MPFGPKNAPVFYTVMMRIIQDEWIILLNNTTHIVTSDPSLTHTFCNRKTIIDDTLLYSNHIPTLLHRLSCVSQVFTKYRLSFKLSKCDFFLPRVEYIGHDLTASGNCLAQSKFQLINDCPLQPHGVSLLSFIGLCSFYSNYIPWFESNINPLRHLQRFNHRQSLPILA